MTPAFLLAAIFGTRYASGRMICRRRDAEYLALAQAADEVLDKYNERLFHAGSAS